MSYTHLCLGVDPGESAGAALVGEDAQGRWVVAWWAWHLLHRRDGDVWRLRQPGRDAMELSTPHEVGGLIERHLRYSPAYEPADVSLCVEGLFARKASAAQILKLGTTKGKLVGPLEELLGPYLEPQAGVWRPKAAGIPARTPKRQAKRLAIAYAHTRLGWRCPTPRAHRPRLTSDELSGVCEAAWMASYGLGIKRRQAVVAGVL
jgi:hypothetical protein